MTDLANLLIKIFLIMVGKLRKVFAENDWEVAFHSFVEDLFAFYGKYYILVLSLINYPFPELCFMNRLHCLSTRTNLLEATCFLVLLSFLYYYVFSSRTFFDFPSDFFTLSFFIFE